MPETRRSCKGTIRMPGADDSLRPGGTSFFGLGGGTGLHYSKEQEIEEAKKRLAELELDVRKIQVFMKVFTKALLANNSQFDSWRATVDSAVSDTWTKGKEYLLSLPFAYGMYKLEELRKARLDEIARESDRALELLSGTTDRLEKERYRAAGQWLKREKGLAEYEETQLKNLDALKTTYDLNTRDASKAEEAAV